jgi:uncharacterized protein (DUF58 family)
MRTGEDERFLRAAQVAASLAYLILKERDGVGLALTRGGTTRWLPVGSTQNHLVRLLQELAGQPPAGEDHLETALRTLLERAERKGLVAVVSDFMFDPVPVQKQLSRLAAQGHEVLLFQLRDPTEEEFPFNRWVQFEDLERPGVRHRVDAAPLKRIYREEYQALLAEWRAWAKKYDIHFVSERTDATMETMLSEYLATRAEVAGR